MSEKIKKVMQSIELDIERYEAINGGAGGEDLDESEIEELLEEEDLEEIEYSHYFLTMLMIILFQNRLNLSVYIIKQKGRITCNTVN